MQVHDSASSPVYESLPILPLRPGLNHLESDSTIVGESPSGFEHYENRDFFGATPRRSHSIRKSDLLWVLGIFVMLCWPWIFLIWTRNGKELPVGDHFARVVADNPQTTNYIVTLLGTIGRVIIGLHFSKAVIRFAQEWTTDDGVTVFDVSMISGLSQQTWPWGLPSQYRTYKYMLASKRWVRVAFVGFCAVGFIHVPSGITTLINPLPFNRVVPLNGTELDFSPNATDCLDWLNANPVPNKCDWKSFGGLNYTNCLNENQIVDVLESGRGNMLSLLSNNSQSLAFSQIGGLHFLGPIRGVLPIGPNGVPAFDTLEHSPFSDARIKARMLSYNYTLEYQGLNSNINCTYDPQSPVGVAPVPGEPDVVLQYSGTCGGADDFLVQMGVEDFVALNSNNSLTFWACKSIQDGMDSLAYSIYLRGRNDYEQTIGNINCTVFPIQPAIFPVTYESIPGIFNSSRAAIATSATAFSGFIDQAVVALGGLIAEAQNFQANLVAESVITFGVKSFQLPYEQIPEYLQLYEAMIQGILEYEVTYIRLVYSMIPNRPPSCDRKVTGSMSYSVIGWSASPEHVVFLMPMTIANLVSFVIFLIAIQRSLERGQYDFDPTGTLPLVLAEHGIEHDEPTGWGDRVRYRSRPARAVPVYQGITKMTHSQNQGSGGPKLYSSEEYAEFDPWTLVDG